MPSLAKWFVLSFLALPLIARAEEWPKWLGPNGTGIATDKIAGQWPKDGPPRVWSLKVGAGFSSIVGMNGKVYFLGMQGNKDVLTALDADSGKVLWVEGYLVGHKPSQPQAQNPENGLPLPNASPTIEGDLIYTYGGGGDLVARNLADGKAVWQINVLDETGAKNLPWNTSSSPLVSGGFVYVQDGDGGPVAVAVNKTSGKIAWKSEDGLGGYAAPILIDAGGTPQLIVFGGMALYALDPATGKTIWKEPWITNYNVNAATPVFHDGHLFITTSYGHGCAMFTVSATAAKRDWERKEISSKFQPCILDDGKLYGNSGGVLKCLAWPTKKVLWASRNVMLNEGGSFVIDGNQMIAMSEDGQLSLAHLEPSGPTVVAQVEVFHAGRMKIWSSPVIYHGKLYVHGNDELVCLEVAAK